MSDSKFRSLVFGGLAFLSIITPIANGGVWLWSKSLAQLIVLVLTFIWFWRMNQINEFKFLTTKLDTPIWLFWIVMLISSYFSINLNASILQITHITGCIGLYYLVVNHLNYPRQIKFIGLIIAIGTALSLLGIAQHYLDLNHAWWNNKNYVSSTYVNHSHFAGYLEMAIALAICIFIGLKRDNVLSDFELRKWRTLLITCLIIMFIAFLLSQSRGGWVAFGAASVFMILILSFKEKILSKWSLPIFLMIIGVFTIFLGLGEDRLAYRLHTFETTSEGQLITGREDVWNSSVNIIRDFPLTGSGIGTFEWAFPSYRPENIKVRYHYTHNDYLQMIVEMGLSIIPILIWGILAFLFKLFTKRSKRDSQLRHLIKLGCAFGVLSLLIHGLVDFNFHIPANMYLFVSLLGILMRES